MIRVYTDAQLDRMPWPKLLGLWQEQLARERHAGLQPGYTKPTAYRLVRDQLIEASRRRALPPSLF